MYHRQRVDNSTIQTESISSAGEALGDNFDVPSAKGPPTKQMEAVEALAAV